LPQLFFSLYLSFGGTNKTMTSALQLKHLKINDSFIIGIITTILEYLFITNMFLANFIMNGDKNIKIISYK
jgi:hypothetical protein